MLPGAAACCLLARWPLGCAHVAGFVVGRVFCADVLSLACVGRSVFGTGSFNWWAAAVDGRRRTSILDLDQDDAISPCAGGVKLLTPDYKICVDNTLNGRMDVVLAQKVRAFPIVSVLFGLVASLRNRCATSLLDIRLRLRDVIAAPVLGLRRHQPCRCRAFWGSWAVCRLACRASRRVAGARGRRDEMGRL